MQCVGQTDVITKLLMGYFNTPLMVLRCRLVHNALACTLTSSFFNFLALGTCRLHCTLSILCGWQNIKQIALLSNIILLKFCYCRSRELSHILKKEKKNICYVGLDISMSLLIYCNHHSSLTSSILSLNHTPKLTHLYFRVAKSRCCRWQHENIKDRVKPCFKLLWSHTFTSLIDITFAHRPKPSLNNLGIHLKCIPCAINKSSKIYSWSSLAVINWTRC